MCICFGYTIGDMVRDSDMNFFICLFVLFWCWRSTQDPPACLASATSQLVGPYSKVLWSKWETGRGSSRSVYLICGVSILLYWLWFWQSQLVGVGEPTSSFLLRVTNRRKYSFLLDLHSQDSRKRDLRGLTVQSKQKGALWQGVQEEG